MSGPPSPGAFLEVLGREAAFLCPGCGSSLTSIVTAYGQRAVCFTCDVRWTRIIRHHDGAPHIEPWVKEAR